MFYDMDITARLIRQLENKEINLETNFTILLRIKILKGYWTAQIVNRARRFLAKPTAIAFITEQV